MPSRAKKKASEAASQDTDMPDEPQPGPAEDDEMGDAVEEDDEVEEQGEDEEELEAQRVKILPGSTDAGASFEFTDEGHTLGNALRWIMMKNPDVELCAYTIPHPAEPKMNLRVQMYEGNAVDALKKGLHDLQDVCDVVAEEFWNARQAFISEGGNAR